MTTACAARLELEEILLNHCYDMGILRRGAESKKKEAILDNLIAAIVRTNLTKEDVENCIKDVNKDGVINLDFFKKGGNLFRDYINPKWVEFAKALFRQRSVGLGTPNAASGEGELMFLFLSKAIKKPTSGDLKIGNEIIELKGEDTRVFGDIQGDEFRKKTVAFCNVFGLVPNKADRTKLDAVEIEKKQHLDYWKGQLSKFSLEKQKEFVVGWLKCVDGKEHYDSVSKIFGTGSFNYDLFIRELVKILFSVMVENGDFDKFIILGNGENAKILSKDIDDFNRKIDNGEIILQSDYFRINQKFKIGWYII